MSQTKVNLLNATKEERQTFLDSFDYLLTDCDGTVWDLTKPFAGVSEAITALKHHGKEVVYVSNNATRSEESYNSRFESYGFDATFKDNVIHPGTAAIDYLRSIDFKGSIYLIGTTCLKDLLTSAGFDVITEDHKWEPIDESLAAIYLYSIAPLKVSAVFLDADINLTMKQLIRAQMLLGDPECKFIAGATDAMLPLPRPMLGVGPFIKVLEDATQRKAVTVGKPGAGLRDIILAKYNITDPKRVLFVGDMLEQDVGFGKLCGFQTLLVLFRQTADDILAHTNPDEVPDFWLPCFADLSQVLADLNRKSEQY